VRFRTICLILTVTFALVAITLTISYRNRINILVEKTDHRYDGSGKTVSITKAREAIRYDGTRAVTRSVSFPSALNPAVLETEETQALERAGDRISRSIMPTLRMYAALPVPSSLRNNNPRQSACTEQIAKLTQAAVIREYRRFGQPVQLVSMHIVPETDPGRTWNIEMEMYPALGCIVGDKTTEIRDSEDGKLISRRVIQLSTLQIVPDDASRFTGAYGEFAVNTGSRGINVAH
jgi:hypothetical protein